MKKLFDIKFRPQIESGEYKVVTSFGEPAEIVKWDCKGQYPLLACIFDGDTDDAAFYTEEGKGMCNSKLFLITPEPELSEFEHAFGLAIVDAPEPEEKEEWYPYIKEKAAELLDLARKEALKDLPRWRKHSTTDNSHFYLQFHDRALGNRDGIIIYNGYEIRLSDLEKLPGFKEN